MWKNHWEYVSTPLIGLILLTAFGALTTFVLWNSCSYDQNEQFLRQNLESLRRGESSQLDLSYVHGVDAYLKEVAPLPALTGLRLDNTDITDAGIKELGKSPQLKTVVVNNGKIDDKAIDSLSLVQNLEELELSNTLVTDEGIHALNRLLHLRAVTIGYDRFKGKESLLTDRALKYLGQLKHINRIELNGHWFTSEAVAELRRNLPATLISSDAERPNLGKTNAPPSPPSNAGPRN
jgi:Leucine-rich repeat (LRR) protein